MGDPESPPPAKKAKVQESFLEESDDSMAKLFLSLDMVQDKLLQHQEAVEQKIAMLKAKMHELSKPLFDERRRITSKIPGFWRKAVCDPLLTSVPAIPLPGILS